MKATEIPNGSNHSVPNDMYCFVRCARRSGMDATAKSVISFFLNVATKQCRGKMHSVALFNEIVESIQMLFHFFRSIPKTTKNTHNTLRS